MRHILTLIVIVLTSILANAEEPSVGFTIEVDMKPQGTYLRRSPGDFALTGPSSLLFSIPIPGAGDARIQPGDILMIRASGNFQGFPGQGETEMSAAAVFSNSTGGFLFPGDKSSVAPIVTLPSAEDSIPTDIFEDFEISFSNAQMVEVPAEAFAMFFTVNDSFFADNGDLNQDLKITITIDVIRELDITNVLFLQTVIDPDIVLPNILDPTTQIDEDAIDSEIQTDGVIDLVQGKSALILVQGTAKGFTNDFLENQLVEVLARVRDPEGFEIDSTVEALIFTDGQYNAIIEVPTDKVGRHDVFIILDPENKVSEFSEADNFFQARQYDVSQTALFNIGLTRVASCSSDPNCYGDTSPGALVPFSSLEQISFLTKIFPVADQGQLNILTNADILNGSTDSTVVPGSSDRLLLGLYEDALQVAASNVIGNQRKTVGIVPKDYICFHHEGCRSKVNDDSMVDGLKISGIAFPGLNVAFVEEGFDKTFAHEIAHLLGQGLELYPDEVNPDNTVTNDQVERFFPGIDVLAYKSSGNDFNQLLVSPYVPIMGDTTNNPGETFWITKNTYLKTMSTLLTPEIDPELIVVTAFADRNGGLRNIITQESPSGKLTPVTQNGQLSVQSFDVNGSLLYEASTNPDFRVIYEGNSIASARTVEVDEIPVIFSIPKTEDVAMVKVVDGDGQVVFEQEIGNERLISDLIKEILASEFRGKYSFIKKWKRSILISVVKRAERFEQEGRNRKSIWAFKKAKKYISFFLPSKYYVDGELRLRKDLKKELRAKIKSLRQ